MTLVEYSYEGKYVIIRHDDGTLWQYASPTRVYDVRPAIE